MLIWHKSMLCFHHCDTKISLIGWWLQLQGFRHNMPGLAAPYSKIFQNLWSGCVPFTRSSDIHLVPTWKKPITSIRLLQSGTLLFLLFNITKTPTFSKQHCTLFSDLGILYLHNHWLMIQLVWQAIELETPTWRPSISKRELFRFLCCSVHASP